MKRRPSEPVRSGSISPELADPIVEDLIDDGDVEVAVEHARRAGSDVWRWLTIAAWRRWRDDLAALDLAPDELAALDRTVPRFRDRRTFEARPRFDRTHRS